MKNPFEILEIRLNNIEHLLLDIKHNSNQSNTPKENSDQLLTIKEASELLNLSIPTIYSYVSKREIPHFKHSKRLYFSRLELIDFLKIGKRLSNSEINKMAKEITNKNKSL